MKKFITPITLATLAAALLLGAATPAKASAVYWFVHEDIYNEFKDCGALLVYAPGGINNPVITKNPDGSISFANIGTIISGSYLSVNPNYGEINLGLGIAEYHDFTDIPGKKTNETTMHPESFSKSNEYIGRYTGLYFPNTETGLNMPSFQSTYFSKTHSTFFQNDLDDWVGWETWIENGERLNRALEVEMHMYMIIFDAPDIANASNFYVLESYDWSVSTYYYSYWEEVVFNMPAGGLGNSAFTIVPEPASFALLAIGAAVAGLRRRRR